MCHISSVEQRVKKLFAETYYPGTLAVLVVSRLSEDIDDITTLPTAAYESQVDNS